MKILSMIKCVIFNADGMVIDADRFSVQYAKDFGVSPEKMLPFFEGIFHDCLTNKVDIKEVLPEYFADWGWQGTIDELLQYWFKAEHKLNQEIVGIIKTLQDQGIKCYLATNNEKYRTQYLKKDMGLDKLFDDIFSSADLGYEKVDQQFMEKMYTAINKGIEKREVMFWDNENKHENLATAKKFGFSVQHYQNMADFQEKIKTILK